MRTEFRIGSGPGGEEMVTGAPDGDVGHEWGRFKIGASYPESIVKGKKLTFKFTRAGSDSAV